MMLVCAGACRVSAGYECMQVMMVYAGVYR